jgi:isoleucyl-tRNA synthetase
MVKDTTITAQFKVKRDSDSEFLYSKASPPEPTFSSWPGRPRRGHLPSNCALAVGENITYVKVSTFNPYTYTPVCVVLAKDLVKKYFKAEGEKRLF